MPAQIPDKGRDFAVPAEKAYPLAKRDMIVTICPWGLELRAKFKQTHFRITWARLLEIYDDLRKDLVS